MGEQSEPVETAQIPETAAGPETEVTNTAAETTTPPAEAPSESKGSTAAGVDSYLFEKNKLLEKLKSEPPAQATATEETPPEVVETPPVAAAPEPEPEKATERIRLSGLPDGHLVAAANEIARAEKIPFAQAWDRVAPKTPEPTQEVIESGPTLRTRAEVEKDIAAAREERKAAAKSADSLEAGAASKMVETEERLESLREELGAIEWAEAEAEEAQRTQYSQTVDQSKEKAVTWFPEAIDPESAFSKRMVEIADAYEADPDPNVRALAYDPNSPFAIALAVANEMGIVPAHLRKTPANGAKPSTPAAATRPQVVNQRAVGRPTQPAASPASGGARTVPGNAEDELGLYKIRTPHDYGKLIGRLTGQKR